MNLKTEKSFTLVEMLLATVVVAVGLCGILATYVGCYDVLNTSKNINLATNAAQGVMEQIRNDTFTDVINYDGSYSPVTNMPQSMLVVHVDDANLELLVVTISVCWKQKGRAFGEDKNLNHVLDAGEDANGNGIIDSPVELVSLISNH